VNRTLTPISETLAQSPADLRHVHTYNATLASAQHRAGEALVWEQLGRTWGALRTVRGAHVAFGSNELDALKNACGVSL
jgi:hypothetical protein